MHEILVEKPYKFTPPITWHWPQRLLTRFGQFQRLIRDEHGIIDHECRHVDRLRASVDAGHGIMLTPNHPRTTDPVAMYFLCREAPISMYTMASWHLFNQSAFKTFMVRLMGAFSVNREGLDRAAVDYAVNVLVEAKRPLLIFPAGATSRTNDRLMALMEGPGFIARTAAKKRAKTGQKVVVHPIAIKYLYQGDIEKTGNEVLTDLERKLTWTPDPTVPLMERIIKLGNAVLTLKELEFNVQSMLGKTLRERQNNMVDHLMFPLEKEWLGATEPMTGGIQSRVKNLRMKIFPEMSRDEIDQTEKDRRWQQLSQTYLAQQIDCYPENYIVDLPSVDRLIDTLEKFEEDLIGQCRIHGKTKVILDVGEAIEVSPKRERGAKSDPLMAAIREQLNGSLEQLQHESRMYEGKIYGQD
ncbi:1-acyl-sn-glycerol-3-phosphate acyltransferase [Mariniblastus sp.]|nr:1-acyl-sn-glycerol-3-phosphate acyltransferase [Mariniblastus sp.]